MTDPHKAPETALTREQEILVADEQLISLDLRIQELSADLDEKEAELSHKHQSDPEVLQELRLLIEGQKQELEALRQEYLKRKQELLQTSQKESNPLGAFWNHFLLSMKGLQEASQRITSLLQSAKQASISALQTGSGWASKLSSLENYFEYMSSLFLEKDPSSPNKFRIHDRMNEDDKFRLNIGLGHILPTSVYRVRITDDRNKKRPKVLEGIRDVRNGRVGYFTESGRYIPVGKNVGIFSGTVIEILEVRTGNDLKYQALLQKEKEWREKRMSSAARISRDQAPSSNPQAPTVSSSAPRSTSDMPTASPSPQRREPEQASRRPMESPEEAREVREIHPNQFDVIMSLGYGYSKDIRMKGNAFRARVSAKYAAANPDSLLIATGGPVPSGAITPPGSTQAGLQKQIWDKDRSLEAHRNGKDRIFIESDARTTKQNIRNTYERIRQEAKRVNPNPVRILFVTHGRTHPTYLIPDFFNYHRKMGATFPVDVSYAIREPVKAPSTAPVPGKEVPPPAVASGKMSLDFVSQGRERGDTNYPYRYHESSFKSPDGQIFYVANSGAPGSKGGVSFKSSRDSTDTKESLVYSQLKFLSSAKGVRIVLSLDSANRSFMQKACTRLGITLKTHAVSNRSFLANRKIVQELAGYYRGGKSVLVHCMNGAHRAPAITAMALIEAGFASSLGQAFRMAGLQPGRYLDKIVGPGGRFLLRQIYDFAVQKGIQIEENVKRSVFEIIGDLA